MFADLYTPKNDPMALQKSSENGMISVYAQNRDYHDIIKKRLKKVGGWLVEQQPSEQIKVFVDTAPLMEKPLAQAAGIGWQGKHTNLVSRDLGNWFFLGSILTTIELEPDSSELDSCGTCRACLDVCPTNAFPAPYKLDATKCISYLTIEHRGPVDINLRGSLGNHIYGCDDCLAVCPWNKFAKTSSEIRYSAREDLSSPNLGDLSSLSDDEFRKKFSGSPIKRIGRNRFVRNVLYAIGNSKSKKLAQYASKLTNDTDYAVSDAAKWALENINVDS
jgi:epoxyqueuosine reductase